MRSLAKPWPVSLISCESLGFQMYVVLGFALSGDGHIPAAWARTDMKSIPLATKANGTSRSRFPKSYQAPLLGCSFFQLLHVCPQMHTYQYGQLKVWQSQILVLVLRSGRVFIQARGVIQGCTAQRYLECPGDLISVLQTSTTAEATIQQIRSCPLSTCLPTPHDLPSRCQATVLPRKPTSPISSARHARSTTPADRCRGATSVVSLHSSQAGPAMLGFLEICRTFWGFL